MILWDRWQGGYDDLRVKQRGPKCSCVYVCVPLNQLRSQGELRGDCTQESPPPLGGDTKGETVQNKQVVCFLTIYSTMCILSYISIYSVWEFSVDVYDVPHLQQGSLDSQNLHGVSAGKDLQRVSCLTHCLDFLVNLCSNLTVWRKVHIHFFVFSTNK